ncbi:MAG TPA: hypothetical protein VK483_05025 [Chitinophagaceae bacterium]|nr:hypothetical protein [Chitinophagaceae bacterium]
MFVQTFEALQEIAAANLFVKIPCSQANSTGNKASSSIHQCGKNSGRNDHNLLLHYSFNFSP